MNIIVMAMSTLTLPNTTDISKRRGIDTFKSFSSSCVKVIFPIIL